MAIKPQSLQHFLTEDEYALLYKSLKARLQQMFDQVDPMWRPAVAWKHNDEILNLIELIKTVEHFWTHECHCV